MQRFFRKLELGSSIATGLAGICLSIVFAGSKDSDLVVLFFAAPALLVALGSCVHIIGRENIGVGLLVWGGTILTMMFFVFLGSLGGLFYIFQMWAFGFLAVSLLAILSLLAALFARLAAPTTKKY